MDKLERIQKKLKHLEKLKAKHKKMHKDRPYNGQYAWKKVKKGDLNEHQ